jgi:hypothetical protein
MVQLLIQFGKYQMNKSFWLVWFLLPVFQGNAQEILLNELSASVTNSQVDNYGEFEDWVEIFNSSKSDVNLAGWYLSDNPAKPFKWRIPASNPKITTILAGSYLLLWADKDTMQGPDHLGFSLKKKGEYLFLYRPTKDGPVLEDSVRYGALSPDQSFGRCPDQTNEWTVFKHPTPGKQNICVADKKRKLKKIPLPAPPDLLQNWPDIVQSSGNNGVILTINEICSNNKYSYLDGFGENDDWIELYNPGTVAINIAGWYISDTLNTAIFHRIPSSDLEKTLVPAGGYLILWADGQSAQGVTHLPFKLDKDGEELYLARLISGQYTMIDEVVFPKAKNDVTYGRIPNGTGTWKRLSDPTPLGPNMPPRILSGFVMNELMAVSGPGLVDEFGEEEDWIEFYNPTVSPINLGGLYLTDSLANPIQSHVTIYSPDSTTIPPGGYLLFYADNETWQGARHVSFKLPSKGAGIILFQPDGSTIISETIYPYQTADASFGRYPDGQENWVNTAPTPGQANRYDFIPVNGLFINELMADNKTTFPDNLGQIEDWIEFYNTNNIPVNVGGLYVTDSLPNPMKFRIPNTFPDSTTIAAKGFMVFWADNHPERGVRHLDFKLAAAGESIALTQVNKNGQNEYLDSITYPAQSSDVSYGRLGDAAPWWVWFRTPSPSASNSAQSADGINLEPTSISVYPNPCINKLNIRILLNNSTDVHVDFFSEGGEKITQRQFDGCQPGWNSLQIGNLGNRLCPGHYFLRITAGKQISYRNFLLIK